MMRAIDATPPPPEGRPVLARGEHPMRLPVTTLLCLVAACSLLPSAATAKAHLWKFTEVFSNVDGNIQFIEMFVFDPAGTAETQLGNKTLESDANLWHFPNDLPMENTFERWILIATPDFAALPGAPTPDYIIPPRFFDPTGDELRYRTTRDVLTLPAGAFPVDGLLAYLRDGSTATNSPTNFAGVMGSVDASAPCDDGLDNDGDGQVDFGDDPGCAALADPDLSERDTSGALPCDDGDDDDGDGYADYPDDPGCRDASWSRESSQCQDGINNDGQLGTDFDAGVSILGEAGANPAGPDPECVGRPWHNREKKKTGCGLGFEVVPALIALSALRRRRERLGFPA
jgi:hypothetical protein